MKPTPPRGFIVVDVNGQPVFIRASSVAAVKLDDAGTFVMFAGDSGYHVTDDISEVVDAVNAASAVEQNGVAASFVANVVEQMLKQQAGANKA